MIWFAGTRESEQPIQRNFGACCSDKRSKKRGSSRRTPSAQSRLLRSSSLSSVIRGPWRSLERDAHILGFGEEAHRLEYAFAAQARLAAAAKGRAQVAHQPGVDPDDTGVDVCGQSMRAR